MTRTPNNALRRGFTLVEILASMLLLSFGLAAALGMVGYATSLSSDYLDRATGMATAETVMLHREPLGLTADSSDLDGDGWQGTWQLGNPSASFYLHHAWGWVNGYYVEREESTDQSMRDNDRINPSRRWVTITVRLYNGEGGSLTTLKRRLLRRTR